VFPEEREKLGRKIT